jgi:hypothetical protein
MERIDKGGESQFSLGFGFARDRPFPPRRGSRSSLAIVVCVRSGAPVHTESCMYVYVQRPANPAARAPARESERWLNR